MDKTTLVLGASTKSTRFSNKAVKLLRRHKIPVIAVGLKNGKIDDVEIQTEFPKQKVHTITFYLNPARQEKYFDLIEGNLPIRIIFNPGTENPERAEEMRNKGVEVVEHCTLVMLNNGIF